MFKTGRSRPIPLIIGRGKESDIQAFAYFLNTAISSIVNSDLKLWPAHVILLHFQFR